MTGLAASCMLLLSGVLALSSAGNAAAEGMEIAPGRNVLLAGIVVPAQDDSAKRAAKSATTVRSKAKAYQESTSANPTVIVVPEEEEEGMLGPRRQPEGKASDNRFKARQYQQGGENAAQGSIPVLRDAGNAGSTNSDHAAENKARARSYVSSDNTVVIERIGSDGIPIVSCGKLVANVAGRIGDDMQPGGVFFIMRDNKPFKVRCSLQ